MDRSLAASTFDFVAEGGKLFLDFVTVVALDLDVAVFNRSASATELFELLGERDPFAIATGNAGNDGDSFAAPLLPVTHNTDDSIAFLFGGRSTGTAAVLIGLSTVGAGRNATTFSRVNYAI